MAGSYDFGEMPSTASFTQPWDLQNLPPEGHPEVGPFFYKLFQEALNERTRLELDKRMDVNYRMYRGNHWGNLMGLLTGKTSSRLSLALLSTNINKTVSNICAKAPVATVNCDDGINDVADRIAQQMLDRTNNLEEFIPSMQRSALGMEIYGITIEKSVFDISTNRAKVIVVDPYSFLVAPGYYEDINDAPYLIHMSAMLVEDAKRVYNNKDIKPDERVFTILGEHREDYRKSVPSMMSQGSGRYAGNYVPAQPISADGTIRHNRVLVIEVWIRDFRRKDDAVDLSTPEKPSVGDIQPLFHRDEPNIGDLSDFNPGLFPQEQQTPPVEEEEKPEPDSIYDNLYYPGGIRVVSLCNSGTVLADLSNPSINDELPYDMVKNTYLFARFPFAKANSYEDMTSIWGFSQCELTGDINLAVDKLWSNIMYHLNMSLFPPLILPKDTKIQRNTVRFAPRLILEPVSTATAGGIKFLELPAPPAMLFQILDALVKFFDRISALEDPTQNAKGGAVAASAIQMLQERASLLIQAKIRAVDHLVRQRGRHIISLWQNFGTKYEDYIIDKSVVKIRGVDFVGRKMDYVVESGSTLAQSSSQKQAQAMQLFQLGAITRQALLKELAFPGASDIERELAQGAVPQALQVLAQAGLPQEVLMVLQQALSQIMQQQHVDNMVNNLNPQGGGGAVPGQQQGQGMQVPGQGKTPGASPSTGAGGGAVGAPGGAPGAPSQPGVPKSQQGLDGPPRPA